MNTEYVIVNKHTSRIYNFCTPETAAQVIEQANAASVEAAERCERFAGFPNDTDSYFAKQAAEYRAQIGQFELMTLEQFQSFEREYLLNVPVQEIDADRFDEMLNVLPPICWTTVDGVEMFCMCEMYTGSYSHQFAHDHRTDKYYSKLVDVRDRSTWIYNLLRA